MPFHYLDLFCGIGSFHQSLKRHGHECVMACDIDPSARATYQANHGLAPLGDIYHIDPATLPPYDLICAGFPCQPFSQAGKHKGLDDERGTVFYQIMKFLDHSIQTHHTYPLLLLENVPALLRHDHGHTLQRLSQAIESRGYHISYKVLKCSDYGIPQMRRRIFLLASKEEIPTTLWDFTEHQQQTTLSKYLGKPFRRETAFTIRCGGRQSAIDNRHNWDGYWLENPESPETPIPYRLSIEDALRLQGFPADFQLHGTLTQQWKQLGNTIPTIFTDILIQNIQKTFSTTQPS